MKNTSKKIGFMAVAIVLSMGLFFSSCKKEVGPAGANGKDGNANVMQYNFGSKVVGSGKDAQYITPNLTAGMLDSSVVMVYYSQDGNQWNVAGGCGPLCRYQTILYTDPSPFIKVYLEDPDGTSYSGSDVTWVKSRVLIIPANKFGKKSSLPAIDFNDYNAVKKYYNLKD